uniref:Dynein light chain n=1 Tax=Ditylenchus dipsaci TaxID=166011 RepID=A0A915CZF3_9BILA
MNLVIIIAMHSKCLSLYSVYVHSCWDAAGDAAVASADWLLVRREEGWLSGRKELFNGWPPCHSFWLKLGSSQVSQKNNTFFWLPLLLHLKHRKAGYNRYNRKALESYYKAAIHTSRDMGDRKAVIKNADMSEEMQQEAIECATQALEKYNIEKDIAAYIKKEFDKKFNPTWHTIVGRNFGSYVTHETKHFIYFYLGQVAILLFKSG